MTSGALTGVLETSFCSAPSKQAVLKYVENFRIPCPFLFPGTNWPEGLFGRNQPHTSI